MLGFTLDKYAHWMPGEHKSQVDELDNLHLSAPHAHPAEGETQYVIRSAVNAPTSIETSVFPSRGGPLAGIVPHHIAPRRRLFSARS